MTALLAAGLAALALVQASSGGAWDGLAKLLGGRTEPVRTSPGIRTVTMPVPGGNVVVMLPEDLAPGDKATAAFDFRWTGSIARYPSWTVTACGSSAPLAPGAQVVFRIPSDATTAELSVADAARRVLGRTTIDVAPARATRRDAVIPAFVQLHGPLVLHGSFDGDATTTSVTIAGRPATPWIESPRCMVLDGPSLARGKATMVVSDTTGVVTGTTQVVRVTAAPVSVAATRGERITVLVSVTGLDDPPPAASLHVELEAGVGAGTRSTHRVNLASARNGGTTLAVPMTVAADGTFHARARLRTETSP